MRPSLKSILSGAVSWLLLLLLLAGRAQANAFDPLLPEDVTLSHDAGRGGLIFLNLELVDGTMVPVVMDTGAPITLLDQSLEPKLGRRVDTAVFSNFGVKMKGGVYEATSLRLGRHLLLTGPMVGTVNCKRLSRAVGRPVLGILGMDCLAHYCIQLDFTTGKMRFLNPDRLYLPALGQAHPLFFLSVGQNNPSLVCPFLHRDHLFGGPPGDVLIDTGCNIDGGLQQQTLKLLRNETGLKHLPNRMMGSLSRGLSALTGEPEVVRFAKIDLDGENYTNFYLRTWSPKVDSPNLLGLRFLARNLVTLDFPAHLLYLKKLSTGPLVDETVF